MANLPDSFCVLTVGTHLVMRAVVVVVSCMHLPSLHKTAPVLWHRRTDSSSQTTEQTSTGCSTEIVDANANTRMAAFSQYQWGKKKKKKTRPRMSALRNLSIMICKRFGTMCCVTLARYPGEKRESKDILSNYCFP